MEEISIEFLSAVEQENVVHALLDMMQFCVLIKAVHHIFWIFAVEVRV